MKILIVGGTGVLSNAVVRSAIVAGVDVTMINRGKHKDRIPENVELIVADINDPETIGTALKGRHFDAVIDFLCYNKKQIRNSISLFKDSSEQYIFISTACVYDTSIPGLKDEEAKKVLKDWNYSYEKWECEQYVESQAEEFGFNYTIIRPCVTYDDTRIPYGIMPAYGYHWTVAARILANKPIISWDGGNARWNVMRVEDFANGVVGLLGNEKAYGQAINICGDHAYSWNEIMSCTGAAICKEPFFFNVPSDILSKEMPGREGEIAGRALDAVIDNKKLKNIVPDYAERITLEEGIGKTIDAYKSKNYQSGIDWEFDAIWDRIIEVQSKGKIKPSFVDYLNNASFMDRIKYYAARYPDRLSSKTAKIVLSFIRKIQH